MKPRTRTKVSIKRTNSGSARARRGNVAQVLLVLGMHRSGTSALTRVFSLLGADLPKNMLGPNPTNEVGHWESLDLIAIHDDLLATAGSQWDDWRAFNPDWIQSGVAEGFRGKLLGLLKNDFAGSPLFVVKDPRICRFVPLWLDVVERFGADACIVIPVRNPLEVAASLKRRNDFPPAKSYLLWLRHVLDAERATRHLPRAVVPYKDLLDDWRGVITEVTAKTGLHWPRRSDRAELDIDRFLADALRHHVADDVRLSARSDIIDWVKEAYSLLIADQREAKNKFKRLDRIHAEFDEACTAFGLVLQAETEQTAAQLESAQTQIKTRDEEVVRLLGELTQARSTADEAQAASTASQSRAAALAAELEAERAAAAAVETRIAEIGAQLAATTSASEELNRQGDQLAAALEAEKVAAAQNRTEAASLAQDLKALRAVVHDHETAAAKLKADLDSAQSAANSRKTELDKLSGELTSARSVAKDRDGAVERLLRDLDATRSYLRESQTEVQRLAGERDGAHAEMRQAKAELERLSAAFDASSSELDVARSQINRLQEGRGEHHLAAAQVSAAREEAAGLEATLEKLRQEILRETDRSEEETAAAALALRIRDLEARLAAESGEKDRLARELAQTAADLRRVERNAADRATALEADRVAALAESENRAQLQIRALRDQLIDAEARLAKAKKRRRSTWMMPFSNSRRDARRLKSSGLFDVEWYLREYPDIAASGRSAAEHYLEEGYLRGYRPNPLFDTRWYLDRYDDVRRSGVNPLVHYLQHGCSEGRNPGPEFETDFYLLSNPDVRSSGVNPLAHYLQHGKTENRLPTRPKDND